MIKAVYAAKIRLHGKVEQFKAYINSTENQDDGQLSEIWLQAIHYVLKIYQEIKEKFDSERMWDAKMEEVRKKARAIVCNNFIVLIL